VWKHSLKRKVVVTWIAGRGRDFPRRENWLGKNSNGIQRYLAEFDRGKEISNALCCYGKRLKLAI